MDSRKRQPICTEGYKLESARNLGRVKRGKPERARYTQAKLVRLWEKGRPASERLILISN
jgi:hypothetical protein